MPQARVRIKGRRKFRERPARADLSSAPFPQFQRDAGVLPQIHDLSQDEVALARDGFSENAHNCQRVLVGSPMGTPNKRGVGDVLTDEGV